MVKIKETIEAAGDALDKNFTSKEEKMTLANENTIDARSMQESANLQEDRFTKRAVYYLAFIWSGAGIAYIFSVSFIAIPENNQRLVDTITGFLLGTIIAAIINFFFGSSHGSKIKTGQMNNLISKVFRKK
jgi:hypothetical protein